MIMMYDAPSAVFLPNELIAEILSYLSVKALMRLRSVSKAWKTLISNPTFVNLHLQRSSRNPHVTIDWVDTVRDGKGNFIFWSRVLSLFPVRRLLENPPIIVDYGSFCNSVVLRKDVTDSFKGEYTSFVGSYNGLVCFSCRSKVIGDDYSEYWLNFRNLAMGTITEKLGYFRDYKTTFCPSFKFSSGYDNSTRTYKVVAYRILRQDYNSPSWTSEVQVFNLGDNSWRKIQSFPIPPMTFRFKLSDQESHDVVHLFGTFNWLALTNTSRSLDYLKHINAENLVILSLSLATETYTQLPLPKGFNEVLQVLPTLRVLRNYLCFSHDFRGTEFVIWQMREFGVRESWTQFIKVSYETLQMQKLPRGDSMYDSQLLPFYVSENSDTLIFAIREEYDRASIYNRKDDRVERTRFSRGINWFSTMDYVESLVSIT